jgi:hypothetical protein
MKSLLSVLGMVGCVLVMTTGCGDDDIPATPGPPMGNAGSGATLDGGADAGELDASAEPVPVADAAADAASDASIAADADVDVDAGDADVDAGDAATP